MKILVSDIIHSQSATIRDEGLAVYEIAKKYLLKGDDVNISFEGIEIVISSFLNASVGKLYGDFPFNFVDEKVTVTGLEHDDIELLYDTVIPNAKEYYQNKEAIDVIEKSVLGS